MTDDDYDALSQKQLASIKRDMRISLEDAAVRATYKVMAELETEQNQGEEHMSKEALIEILKIANCDINTIIFAVNAWEMGAEWQKEQTEQSITITIGKTIHRE